MTYLLLIFVFQSAIFVRAAFHAIFPNQQKVYIYTGEILNPLLTFEDYGFTNTDSVVVLDAKATEIRSWMQITKDNEDFSEVMRSAINPKTTLESARLRDLRNVRSENRRKSFVQMQRIVNTPVRTNSAPIFPPPKIEYQKICQEAPLPIAW